MLQKIPAARSWTSRLDHPEPVRHHRDHSRTPADNRQLKGATRLDRLVPQHIEMLVANAPALPPNKKGSFPAPFS